MKNINKYWRWIMPIFFLGILFILLWVRDFASFGLYGDQIHYLIMVDSIAKDGDLDVKNDYELKRYTAYFDEPNPTPHVLPNEMTNDSSWYSIHNPGLPILLAIPFKYFGTYGAITMMVILSWLLLVLVYCWTYKVVRNRWAASMVVFALFTAQFFLNQVGYIFTDVAIIDILLLGILISENKKRSRWQLFILSLLLGLGVWVHVKMILALATIGVVTIWQIMTRKKGRERILDLITLIFPSFLLIGIFEWKLWQWYGVWLPTSTFAGHQMFSVNPFTSMLAAMFDRSKGILINNPTFFLIFLGLPTWYKKNPNQVYRLLAIVGPTLFLHFTFNDWCGGWSPSGRYMMSFLPIFLPAVGYIYFYLKNIFIKIFCAFLILGQIAFSYALIFYMSGWSSCGGRSNTFIEIEKRLGWGIDNIMPAFRGWLDLESGWEIYKIIFFVLLTLGISFWGYRLSKQIKIENNNETIVIPNTNKIKSKK